MIIKEYTEIENRSNKLVALSGFISAVVVLLVLLPELELQYESTKTVFAQVQNNNSGTLASNSSQALNSTQVGFVSNIEQIRGHLNAAVMNKEAGNTTLAKAHTLHPIAEIYSSIEPQISNANITLNETLATNLNQLSEIVNVSSIEEFDAQSQRINGLESNTTASNPYWNC